MILYFFFNTKYTLKRTSENFYFHNCDYEAENKIQKTKYFLSHSKSFIIISKTLFIYYIERGFLKIQSNSTLGMWWPMVQLLTIERGII